MDTQGWNRYSYVKGNPIAYKDPTGHDAIAVSFVQGAESDVGKAVSDAVNSTSSDLENFINDKLDTKVKIPRLNYSQKVAPGHAAIIHIDTSKQNKNGWSPVAIYEQGPYAGKGDQEKVRMQKLGWVKTSDGIDKNEVTDVIKRAYNYRKGKGEDNDIHGAYFKTTSSQDQEISKFLKGRITESNTKKQDWDLLDNSCLKLCTKALDAGGISSPEILRKSGVRAPNLLIPAIQKLGKGLYFDKETKKANLEEGIGE